VLISEMRTRLSKLIKDPSNTVVSSADLDLAINDSLDYWKQKRFWFNEEEDAAVTLVVGTGAVSDMPTNILYTIKNGGFVLDYQDRRYEVRKIAPARYDAMNNETSGRPRYYTYRNDAYEVYPYPDLAYTGIVRYIKDYDDLSDSNTSNDFSNNAPLLLLYDAASRLTAERNQDEKMETYFTARMREEEKKLISRTNRNNSTGTIAVYG